MSLKLGDITLVNIIVSLIPSFIAQITSILMKNAINILPFMWTIHHDMDLFIFNLILWLKLY